MAILRRQKRKSNLITLDDQCNIRGHNGSIRWSSCRCCEKTVREKLRLCFDLVKYKSVKGIPFAMKNDVIVLINQWLDHAKTLKKCASQQKISSIIWKRTKFYWCTVPICLWKRSFWLNAQIRQITMQKLLNSIRTKVCVCLCCCTGIKPLW